MFQGFKIQNENKFAKPSNKKQAYFLKKIFISNLSHIFECHYRCNKLSKIEN